MTRYYILDPIQTLFLSWNGMWVPFSGAKDFRNDYDAANFRTIHEHQHTTIIISYNPQEQYS